jgi:PAS domain S-box-containing protein
VTSLVGILLSVTLFYVIRVWERDRLHDEFTRRSGNIATQIQTGTTYCIKVLESLGAFFDSSQEVTRQEFRRFVKDVLKSLSMMKALEWVPRVEGSQRAAFEEAARLDGMKGFQITRREAEGVMARAPRRPEHYPIYYIEPFEGNEKALGYDLASDPASLEALKRARDTGGTVVSGRIALVQDPNREVGFLVFKPVYRKRARLETVEERRKNLEGFGLAVFRVSDLVDGWLKDVNPGGISFNLYDLAARPDERFMYHYNGSSSLKGSPLTSGEKIKKETDITSGLHSRKTLDILGWQWSLLFHPTPEFFAAQKNSQAWTVLMGGLMFTALICSFLLQSSRYAAQLEKEVAERKAAEDQLQKLSDVVEQSPVTVAITDTEGLLEYVNPKFTEVTGYKPEEVIGENPRVLKSGEQTREFYKELWDTISSGKKWIGEFDNKTKDGEIYWELASISPMKNKEGIVTHYVKVAEVITDRKRAEKELLRTHERLGQAYESLEKAQASAIAAAKMAALGRLTAGASHEILNPLNGIVLTLHLLMNDPDTAPDVSEELKGTMEQAMRIAKIVDNLLHFCQQREPERCLVDFNTILLRCLSLIEPDINLNNIEVEADPEPTLPHIMADKTQLQQVVLKLLANALDQMPNGGRLTVTTRDTHMDGRRHLELRVEDTGPGIAPENVDKLFEPFFTTKPEGKGTGLGLSICLGIVEAHGGTISAENLPYGGAVFVVRLPIEA